jgi:hypothetical protein
MRGLTAVLLLAAACTPPATPPATPATPDPPSAEPAPAVAEPPAPTDPPATPATPDVTPAPMAPPGAGVAAASDTCDEGRHRKGERWKVECNTCSCGDGGQVMCTRMACQK